MNTRPFRFGVGSIPLTSRAAWIAHAQAAEQLGYTTLVMGDHLSLGEPAPLPALVAAAQATTTLRLATHVLTNDMRNPAVLAHEAATVDLLSDGRLELGLGAGWLSSDYRMAGLSFEQAHVRVHRLIEATKMIKTLWQDGSMPQPAQRPHPPLFIGGGSKRILSFAAQEANIIGLDLQSTPNGLIDGATSTAEAVAQKTQWVREAAGSRWEDLELHVLAHHVVITDDRQRGVEAVSERLAAFSAIASNTDLSKTEILESPHALVGTVEQIVADLQERRQRYGISYITVFGEYLEALSPVVERLAGT